MKYMEIYALDRKVRSLEMRILRAKTKEERDKLRMELWATLEVELLPDPRPSLYSRIKDIYARVTNRPKGGKR